MNNIIWYEVWADEGQTPPYLLLLLHVDHGLQFQVYDATEKRVAFQASSYDSAKDWLLEDEFTRVCGRMAVE
jgi:hypothetical protein